MLRLCVNVIVSVAVIVGATWLSKRQPATAGFVAALPMTTILVLLLGRMDEVSFVDQVRFARSLVVGIPLGATFLVPFIVAPRLGLSFWSSFVAGLVCLSMGYGVHRWIFGT
jgi:hypothetical protein